MAKDAWDEAPSRAFKSYLCNNNVKMKGTVRSSLENFAQSDVFLRSATHEHERWLVLATALLHLAGHNVLSESIESVRTHVPSALYPELNQKLNQQLRQQGDALCWTTLLPKLATCLSGLYSAAKSRGAVAPPSLEEAIRSVLDGGTPRTPSASCNSGDGSGSSSSSSSSSSASDHTFSPASLSSSSEPDNCSHPGLTMDASEESQGPRTPKTPSRCPSREAPVPESPFPLMSLTTADVQAARSRLDELDAAQVAAAAVAAAAPSPAASAKPFVTDALDTLGVLLRDNANKVAAIAAQVVADVTAQQSHHLRQLEEFAAEREALRRSLDEARARVVKAQAQLDAFLAQAAAIETQCESLRARETAAAEHLVAERKRLTEQSHSQFAAVLTSLTSPVRS